MSRRGGEKSPEALPITVKGCVILLRDLAGLLDRTAYFWDEVEQKVCKLSKQSRRYCNHGDTSCPCPHTHAESNKPHLCFQAAELDARKEALHARCSTLGLQFDRQEGVHSFGDYLVSELSVYALQ